MEGNYENLAETDRTIFRDFSHKDDQPYRYFSSILQTNFHFLYVTERVLNFICDFTDNNQGSKIVLVRSYLRVSQAAGQVNILIFLLKIKFSPCMPINFVMQGKCLFSDISRPE